MVQLNKNLMVQPLQYVFLFLNKNLMVQLNKNLMVQLHVNVVQPPVVQLWFQVVPRAKRVVQIFAPEASWRCGGRVVG